MSCYRRTNILCWELGWKKQSCSATTFLQAHGGKPVPVKSPAAAPAAWRAPGGLSWGSGDLWATRDVAADQSWDLAWGEGDPSSAFPSRGDVVQASLWLPSEGLLLLRQLRREMIATRGYVLAVPACGSGPWASTSWRDEPSADVGSSAGHKPLRLRNMEGGPRILDVSLGVDELHFITFIFL